MELNLERPLLFFDIESTGLNIASDCIIELSFVKIFPGGEQRVKTWKVLPWDYATGKQKHIDEKASEVNGVHDEDLVGCPRFAQVLPEVGEWLADCDLAGYNSAKFDLPMLAEEIERARKYEGVDIGVDLHGKQMVDVQEKGVLPFPMHKLLTVFTAGARISRMPIPPRLTPWLPTRF